MVRPILHLFLSLPLLAAACSDNGDTYSGPLIGTWQAHNRATGEPIPGETRFEEDGTWSTVDGDGALFAAGRFEVDGDRLVLDHRGNGGDLITQTTTFHVDESYLFQLAALPDGTVDGVIGTWRSESTTDDLEVVTQIHSTILRADGTAVWRREDIGLEEVGTWVERDGWIDFTSESAPGGPLAIRYFAIPGVALTVSPLFRVE